MKKLALVPVAALLLTLMGPGQAHAAPSHTVTIRANGSVCEQQGSVSPQAVSLHSGQRSQVTFKNAEQLSVEVRNLPGGTFTVPGNSSTTRTFVPTSSFTYNVWSVQGSCEKATGRIEVQGGWTERLWPWVLAGIGSVIVIWMVSRSGRRRHQKMLEAEAKNHQDSTNH